jgi:hypothetical protein
MKVVLVLLLLVTGAATMAQTDAMQELLRLRSFLDKSQNLNFNLAYYYEEDDSSGVVKDTLIGESSVLMGKSYSRLNGLKRVNNEYYNALIDTVNKEIYVNKPEPMTQQYMSANFTDPTFYNYYVDTTIVSDSGAFRIINISFKETAPFRSYKIVYSITSLQPAYLQYNMKKGEDDNNPPIPGPPGGGGGTTIPSIRLKVVFSNFNTNANPATKFSTDVWFTRQNGVLVLQPAFSSYTITDLTGE